MLKLKVVDLNYETFYTEETAESLTLISMHNLRNLVAWLPASCALVIVLRLPHGIKLLLGKQCQTPVIQPTENACSWNMLLRTGWVTKPLLVSHVRTGHMTTGKPHFTRLLLAFVAVEVHGKGRGSGLAEPRTDSKCLPTDQDD